VWKNALGPLPDLTEVDIEMADQRIVPGEVCGPVRVTLEGFRAVAGEVLFVDMEPNAGGSYEPLIGYTVLEACNAIVDMMRHRLFKRRYYDLKHIAAA
ncbi:MAG: hypothetical protein ACREQL_04240, partial [Candidatus Binatia bacterium]